MRTAPLFFMTARISGKWNRSLIYVNQGMTTTVHHAHIRHLYHVFCLCVIHIIYTPNSYKKYMFNRYNIVFQQNCQEKNSINRKIMWSVVRLDFNINLS